MEAGDASPADHHNILNCKVATQTMVGIQLAGRSTVLQNQNITMGNLLNNIVWQFFKRRIKFDNLISIAKCSLKSKQCTRAGTAS